MAVKSFPVIWRAALLTAFFFVLVEVEQGERSSASHVPALDYSSGYYNPIWRGCQGGSKPCGGISILRMDPRVYSPSGDWSPSWTKKPNVVQVSLSHLCTHGRDWEVRSWRSTVFKAKRIEGKGYRFHYRYSRGGVRFTVRGIFRGHWVTGVMKLRNRANGCHTGEVGFRAKDWRLAP